MRNLKRALSLLLSSAMVVGMMVMGGSAAGYQDVDDTYHKEAIEVLQAVGIMTGDENGNFNPEKGVTRNEMAVIMSNLMAYNVATYSGTSPFTDVPSWAEPYVAACWTNGITSGTSATTYGGDETVTTAQAALMIMKALGYFQYGSDFGNDWQLATVSQGNKIDLFVDVNSGVKEAMTRNDVAQLVLNGLESGTVQAETNGSITVGDITIVNDVKYNLITSGEKYAYAINPDLKTSNDGTVSTGSIVELGEKLYLGDLAKKRDVDDFGRPSSVWSYNSNEIGTYADEATYSHNTKVTSKALYNEVGSIAASDYTWHVYHNGEPTGYTGSQLVANKTENDTDFVKKALGGDARTGTGVLTEVYVNNVDKEVYVAIVDTFVGEVTKVEDEAVTIKQFDNGSSKHPDLDSKKFETTDSGLAVGDIVLYTVSGREIMSLQKAESVTGKLTAYQAKDPNNTDTNDNKDSYAKLDDTQYNYAVQMAKNLEDNTDIYPMGLNNEYVFYLDTFGNLIAFEGVEIVDNYLYVENAVASAAGVDAKVRFADGTQKVISISKVKLSTGTKYDDVTGIGGYDVAGKITANGGIYTYSEDNGMYRLANLASGTDKGEFLDLNGTYTFTAAPSVGDTAYGIKQGHSRIFAVNYVAATGWTETSGTSYPVDSSTIFVDVATGEVFTGYQNVPSYGAVEAKVAFGKNGVADVVFIYNQAEKSNSGVYFFVNGDSRETWESNDITYRKYEVYINGEKQNLTTKDFVLDANSVYKQVQVNADGQLVDADKIQGSNIITGVMGNVIGANKATSIANHTLVLAAGDANYNGKSIFNWDDETVFVNINTKYDSTGAVVVDTVEPGAATDIDVVNHTTAVYVMSVDDKSNVTPTAELVYIVTQPDADARATVSFAGTTSQFQVNSSTPASISVVKGNNAIFTITPVGGYKITGVTANYGTLTNVGNTYTLSNVTRDTVVTVNTAADATSYNGTINVTVNMTSTSGRDKTTNAWTVSSMTYQSNSTPAVAPTEDQVVKEIIKVVEGSGKGLTYASTSANSATEIAIAFDGAYSQFFVKYDHAATISGAGQQTTLDKPTSAQLELALSNYDKVVVNGPVTLDNNLNGKLTTGKTLTINGDVTLANDITLASGVKGLEINGNISAAAAQKLDANSNNVPVHFTGNVTIGNNVTVEVKNFTLGGTVTVASGAVLDDYSGASCPTGGKVVFQKGATGKLGGTEFIGDSGKVSLDTADAVITLENGKMTLTSGTATVKQALPIKAGEQVVISSGATLAVDSSASITGGAASTFLFEKGAAVDTTDAPTNFYEADGSTLYTAATLNAALAAGSLSFIWNGTSAWLAN